MATLCSYHVLTVLMITTLLCILYIQPISASPQAYTNFIKTSCSKTTYPPLCTQTLSPFATSVQTNPIKLCNRALNISIQAAHNTSTFVSNLSKQKGLSWIEKAAIKDCMDDLKDCVYQLKQTMSAMGKLGGSDREFQWANAKTWASAAITDTDSCLDGFEGRKVSPQMKNKIKSTMMGVARLTSNALALINHLNY
ncbi:unnamed protein product [Ilex paraguariensis]|uniref:Pectinesterase inhibitor domain-containing protein n=1 Tax=Ilex paraguariensis TaxID=185542 RepID=A0ABC8SV59_9AQUA